MKLPVDKIITIAVFRALQLGDMLCAVPAFRALRTVYPDAKITLLGMPWSQNFVERFSNYLDEFIWFPGYPGLPEQPVNHQQTAAFLQSMQNRKFDLALQMQGNGTIVNSMMELFGAKYIAGFFVPSGYCPDRDLFIEYPETLQEIERHLALMEYLGIPSKGVDLEFPLTEKDYSDFDEINLPVKPQKYVCVHPGSRGLWRQWPPEYFAALADCCAGYGLQVVLTGTKEELPLIESVVSCMRNDAINAAGKTTLGVIAVLIKDAFMLISNCTGVSHIAAATKTKSIVISMDGEPHRWAPLNRQLHRTIDWLKTPDFEFVLNETNQMLK